MGIQPLANKYPISSEKFVDEYLQEMIILFCDNCGYCHLPCEADRAIFFEDYYYLSSVNTELVQHFDRMADELSLLNAKFVLDVGSNDGVLLEPLSKLGIKALGVDPSHNVGAIANQKGLETYIGFFDDKMADRIKVEKGCPDVIVASSVFTHLEEPAKFFRNCDLLLSARGSVIVEVEYLADIIMSLGFERFYYDRPHYYTVKSLQYLAAQYGFEISKVDRIDVHGGSVQVRFRRIQKPFGGTSVAGVQSVMGDHLGAEQICGKFREFTDACSLLKAELRSMSAAGLRVAGYGCPARFSTITNFADIDSTLIPIVIDDSPLKQGRFSPGKHIPIVKQADSASVDTYIVFAYEYIRSIRQKVGPREVNFFRPIPFSRI
jgi:methylation protein EvaC